MESKNFWLRLAYMLFFAAVLYLSVLLVWLIAAIQAITHLFTDRANPQLTHSSDNLAQYIKEIVLFLCFHTERMPFPFAESAQISDQNTNTKE